jgi:alpha-glucosidase (family GH31 glycosyl hydrolase)
MDKFLDFTLDPVKYPPSEMKKFVDELHANGQHYIPITDPGISNAQPKG